MKNKSRSFYLVLGLVGAFWFTGCCTYPGGMVAVYSNAPRRAPAPRFVHHAPPPPAMHHYAPAPHHHQSFFAPSFRASAKGPHR